MRAEFSIVKVGLSRGLIELRQNLSLTFNYVFFPTLALVVMYMLRDLSVSDTDYSLGRYAIPGIIAMNVLFSGLMGIASTLIVEREDGTLLRARAIPNGTLGYFIGKVTSQAALTFFTFSVVLTVAMLLFDDFELNHLASLVTLSWVMPLGLAAMLPIGVILGAGLRHPRQMSFISLVLMGMTAISGIFYPLSLQSQYLQVIGQFFPLYWLGLGMRSAMLPNAVVSTEIGNSWRSLETAVVLGTWAIVGTLLALFVLRKTAHR